MDGSEDFAEMATLHVFDLNQTNEWIEQDSSRFRDADALWDYAMRMKRHGLPVRFTYTWELYTED